MFFFPCLVRGRLRCVCVACDIEIMLRCMLELCRVHVFLIPSVRFHVSDGACLDNSTVIIIEMPGLHDSLRYVVYIFMITAFIFLP